LLLFAAFWSEVVRDDCAFWSVVVVVEVEDCPALDETPDWLLASGGFEVVLGVVVAAPAVPAVPVVVEVDELELFTSVEVVELEGFVLCGVLCAPCG